MSKLFPYIRPTNKKYGTEENGGFWGENGFNCIEVGYLEIDGEVGNEIVKVNQLTPCADVISSEVKAVVSMDAIGDGYLRLYTISRQSLRWQSESVPLSNMTLIMGKPLESIES